MLVSGRRIAIDCCEVEGIPSSVPADGLDAAVSKQFAEADTRYSVTYLQTMIRNTLALAPTPIG